MGGSRTGRTGPGAPAAFTTVRAHHRSRRSGTLIGGSEAAATWAARRGARGVNRVSTASAAGGMLAMATPDKSAIGVYRVSCKRARNLCRVPSMADREPRLTHASLKVLRIFLDNPTARLSGADLHKRSGVFTGTLYPMLVRFVAAGWLDSEWEKMGPKELGRPRRRFYCLTPTGLAQAHAALASVASRREKPSWA